MVRASESLFRERTFMEKNEIYIFRVPKELDWTPIENSTLRDKRLSFAARGLLAHMLSLPRAWELRVTNLVNESPAGKFAVYRMIGELSKYGYFHRFKFKY